MTITTIISAISSVTEIDDLLNFAKMYCKLYLETENSVFAEYADKCLLSIAERKNEEIESQSR